MFICYNIKNQINIMTITINAQFHSGGFSNQEERDNFYYQYNYAKNAIEGLIKEQPLLNFLNTRNITIGLQPLKEAQRQYETTGRYMIADERLKDEFIIVKFKINPENLMLSETFLKTCFSHEAFHSFIEFKHLLKNQVNNDIKIEDKDYLKCIEYFCDEFAAKVCGRSESTRLLSIKKLSGDNPNHPSWQNRVNAVKSSVFSDLVDSIIETANKKELEEKHFNSWKFFIDNKESIKKTITELEK
jgi:hypothetical protein